MGFTSGRTTAASFCLGEASGKAGRSRTTGLAGGLAGSGAVAPPVLELLDGAAAGGSLMGASGEDRDGDGRDTWLCGGQGGAAPLVAVVVVVGCWRF
jgi:hypothetical protein